MDNLPFSQYFQQAMLCMFSSMINYQVIMVLTGLTLIWSIDQLLILNAGNVYGGLENPKLTFSDSVKLRVGINQISLLSVAVGLPVSFLMWIHTINCRKIWYIWSLHCCFGIYQNVGLHFEKWNAGVLGPVMLKGLNEGTRDLSKQNWSYKVHSLYDFCSSLSLPTWWKICVGRLLSSK